jgi:carbonic anhydrase
VTWYVLKTPQLISQNQLDIFAKIYPLNERPVQPLYGREVLASK